MDSACGRLTRVKVFFNLFTKMLLIFNLTTSFHLDAILSVSHCVEIATKSTIIFYIKMLEK